MGRPELRSNSLRKYKVSSEKLIITEILSFIRSSTPHEYRAIQIAMNNRRKSVTYGVSLKNGGEEHWILDDPEQLIRVLVEKIKSIKTITILNEKLK